MFLLESYKILTVLPLSISAWISGSNFYTCALIESKMNEIIDVINQRDSILEADKLQSELRILDWILYQVCSSVKAQGTLL
jgi:hypothetical protein